MNCKPGDLAILIMGDFAGSLVRCIDRYDGPWADSLYEPGWHVEWLSKQPRVGWVCLADFALRPIRDPGDDAVDEMVQKLGKPEEVVA